MTEHNDLEERPPDRFPGFAALSQAKHWDLVTAGVVLSRISIPAPMRFFTPDEQATAAALCDQLLDQRDDPTVPIVNMIDARLAENETDGWHYQEMPEDGAAWRMWLSALDADAMDRFGGGFAMCSAGHQATLIHAVQDLGDRVQRTRLLRRPRRPARNTRRRDTRRHRRRIRPRHIYYYRRMCEAGAVDYLQADVSRCGAITEWLRVAAVAASFGLDISGHCGPHLHAHVAAATPNLRHLEWFHDHVRIETMFFDGTLDPTGGVIRPDPAAPGLGLTVRQTDTEQ